MEPVKLLATLFPLALASGVNLYATILVTGFSIRIGWIHNAPAGLEVFASTPILIITAVFYLLEFFADKIQFIDTVWDTLHTIIRPLGMAFLALATIFEYDPMIGIVAALAAGGVSFVSHTAKAGTRFSLNILSPAENAKNIGISLLEDIFVGAFSFLALKYPYVAAAIALIVFVLLILFLPMLFRWLIFILSAVFFRFTSFFKQKETDDEIKGEFIAILGHPKILASVKCKSKGVKGARGKMGILVLTQNEIFFLYTKFFGLFKKIFALDKAQIKAVYLKKRLLADFLEVHYLNSKGKAKICKFIALKNRAPLLKKIESFFKREGEQS